MHALSCRNMFEIQKSLLTPRLFYFKQHLFTSEVILQQPREQALYFYSTTAIKRADRFPLKKNEVGQSLTSFLNKTAEKVVPLLHSCDFKNADDWFSF